MIGIITDFTNQQTKINEQKEGDEIIPIGTLAASLGITSRTLRYYEEVGIVEPSRRMKGGRRVYTQDDVRRLTFILKLKELGLTVKGMQGWAAVHRDAGQSEQMVPRLIEMLDLLISAIDEKMEKLATYRKDIVDYRYSYRFYCK